MSETEILKMKASEKLKIMELIWNSFEYDDEIESPLWHLSTIEERKEQIRNKSAEFISIRDLKRY